MRGPASPQRRQPLETHLSAPIAPHPRLLPRLTLALIVALAVVAAVATAHGPRVGGGALGGLVYLNLLIPLLPLAALSTGVAAGRVRASGAGGLLGVAVYTLTLGAAFVALAVAWLWTDAAGLGMLFLGGVTALLGAVLLIAAVAAYRADPSEGWRARQPLTLAGAGALATLGVLLWRGPDDWSATAHTLTLYSLPVLVMGGAIALAILDVARQERLAPR